MQRSDIKTIEPTNLIGISMIYLPRTSLREMPNLVLQIYSLVVDVLPFLINHVIFCQSGVDTVGSWISVTCSRKPQALKGI